jgi:hypothetical protein
MTTSVNDLPLALGKSGEALAQIGKAMMKLS